MTFLVGCVTAVKRNSAIISMALFRMAKNLPKKAPKTSTTFLWSNFTI